MANKNPIVTITMENGDVMKAELYPEIAPNTVNNFISLVKNGFYDGLIFHRVINGFMIQGGCPDGTGMGGPGYSIKGEFAQNGVANDLAHTPGVLSMARAMHPNSGGSQFFIMHKAAPHLSESLLIEKKKGISLKVTTDYTGIGKIQYIAGERQIPMLDSEYTDKVVLKLLVPNSETDAVQKAITEGTNGRAVMEKEKELYFAKVNGDVLTFED